uniref:Lipase_GDSL domain-containing protein n=1 Tax=Acrobeloides nanus TaxID=290746 RepID=A0A914DWC4_9BILA
MLLYCALFWFSCLLLPCLSEISLINRNESSRKPFVDEIADPAEIKVDSDFQPKIEFADDINNYAPREASPFEKFEYNETEIHKDEEDGRDISTEEEDESKSKEESNENEKETNGKKNVTEVLQVIQPSSNTNVIDEGSGRPISETVSVISSAFNSRKTFACPRIKSDFVTGTSIANLSPEDIGIITSMGDSLSVGKGLWPNADIEFRGAAFPIGGDATIDGLVTVPNILREFLNVAEAGATTKDLPAQAKELVARLDRLKDIDVRNTWTLIIITVGTEEICYNCSTPNYDAIVTALDELNRRIHKAFVVLLGPIHVSSTYHQKANLLKDRCSCSKKQSPEFMDKLSNEWLKTFERVQEHVDFVKRPTFGLLTLPMLTVTSRFPNSLFISNRPLLNRRGHMYAAKVVWNRLIAGPSYNLSNAILSQDAYFCPSVGCPYFRNHENFRYCKILRYVDATNEDLEEEESDDSSNSLLAPIGRRSKRVLYLTACIILGIAMCTVLTFGTIFYQRSKKGSKGRFDIQPIPEEVYKSKMSVKSVGNGANELLIKPHRLTSTSSVKSAKSNLLYPNVYME